MTRRGSNDERDPGGNSGGALNGINIAIAACVRTAGVAAARKA